jgi:glutathionylspermidine synthase
MQNENRLLSWLQSSGIPTAPFAEGRLRVQDEVAIIPSKRLSSLRKATSALNQAYDELCSILVWQKQYLADFFSFSKTQEILWYISGGEWCGIARADVFFTTAGEIAIAELNSDTPSGLDEAFVLGKYAESQIGGLYNPNKNLPASFTSLITKAFKTVDRPSAQPTVGIVYPTDIPEDMGLVFIYRHWLIQAGYRVVLGSPWNLDKNSSGRLTLFDTEIDVLIRHYKTDWWCERKNVWKDVQPLPESGPLLSLIDKIADPLVSGKLAVINPFGTIITQNKFSLAFFHENIHLFTEETQKNIKKYIPLTRRLSMMDPLLIADEKDRWVLKSDYGCEGAEVAIGCMTPMDEWKKMLELAIPEKWIVQQYFNAEKDEHGTIDNHGIYLINGRPQGLYMRRSEGVTNIVSSIAPVLERPMLTKPNVQPAQPIEPVIPVSQLSRTLLNAYKPTDRWLPFRMPLITYSPIVGDAVAQFHPTKETDRVYSFASQLSEILQKGDLFWKSCMIVCDLNGADSVICAAALSSATDTILQIENIACEQETVMLRNTLGALQYYAPTFEKNRVIDNAAVQRTPLFLLDRKRMTALKNPGMQFNNKHWAYLPDIEFLKQNGIQSILYIHPPDELFENDDLNEDFVQYSMSGIHIFKMSVDKIPTQWSIDGTTMFEKSEYIPVRRQTIFSFLLPADEPVYTETIQP